MKFLIYLALGYLAYVVFLRPMLNPPQMKDNAHEEDNEDEYTDYEELE